MPGKTHKPATVDEYIAQFPAEVQSILQHLRGLIKASVPQAEEKISYNILGYFLDGGLLWLSANKRHIGLYPMSADTPAFKGELWPYRGTKSALHFPLDKPIPYPLIKRIVKYRVAENLKPSRTPHSSAVKKSRPSSS